MPDYDGPELIGPKLPMTHERYKFKDIFGRTGYDSIAWIRENMWIDHPRFKIGDAVIVPKMGKVTHRFKGSDGEWVYEVDGTGGWPENWIARLATDMEYTLGVIDHPVNIDPNTSWRDRFN